LVCFILQTVAKLAQMVKHIKIQQSIQCEDCLICGKRPIIEQINGGKYIVRCPSDAAHYQTPPGLIDIKNWNENNKLVGNKTAVS
jgi:hypothetical protein